MTIASQSARNDYPGAGAAGPFPYTAKIFAAVDLVVMKRDALGVETTLAYPTDYAVTGIGNAAGGTVTLTAALEVGEALTIRRVPALVQSTDLRNQGTYFPETLEDTFDRLVMIDQAQQDVLNRALTLPVTMTPGAASGTLPLPEGGKALVWNEAGTAMENHTLDASSVALPGDGRTVATFTAYLEHNKVFQVADYLPVGYVAGVSDAAAAHQAAINAANGRPVLLMPGTHLVSSISNVPGKPLILLGHGVDSAGTVLQTTAAATVAILVDQLANANFHHLENFTLTGTATNTGGIQWGTAAFRSAFVRLRDVRVINFSGVGAYGMRLDAVQEFDAWNVHLQFNYNNLYRPALGYCTAARFHGPASYNGSAGNVGFLADPFDAPAAIAPLGITFAGKYVFESMTNEAIKATGVWAEITLDDVYTEQCALTAGDVFTLAGTAARPMALAMQNTHFDAKGRAGARNLNLAYIAAGSRVVGNPGLLRSGTVGADVVDTATCKVAYADNGFGADTWPIYQALLGSNSYEELGLTGAREVSARVIQVKAVAAALIQQSTSNSDGANGWVWRQDEAVTGNMMLYRKAGGVETLVATFVRADGGMQFASKVGLNGNAPQGKAAAIASPAAPSAGYVQAEAASMKTAVDAIRVALQNLGITL